MVVNGAFRKTFYRINVVRISLPPLRQRVMTWLLAEFLLTEQEEKWAGMQADSQPMHIRSCDITHGQATYENFKT